MTTEQTPQPSAAPAPQQQAPASPPPAQPQTIPGTSFTTQEALVDSYKSLQAELTRARQAHQPSPQQQQAPTPDPSVAQVRPQQPAQQPQQFSWDNPDQYLTDQGFSDNLVSHLESLGVPKEFVNDVGRSVSSYRSDLQQRAQQDAIEITGSEANWQKTQEYISGLPQAEASALQQALANPQLYKTTLTGLTADLNAHGYFTQEQAAQQSAEPGAMPQVNTGTMADSPLFPNTSDTLVAIQDPRYRPDSPQYDKAYADRVVARLQMGVQQQQGKR